jgi:tetratricopeptide (TPR) repeat protein
MKVEDMVNMIGMRLVLILLIYLVPMGAGWSATAPLKSQSGSDSTVGSLVAAATGGDFGRLQQIITQMKSQPRPTRGDRNLARQLNERGLALSQRQRYAEAASSFAQAYHADASDPEIRENLGYSLLKAGDVSAAEPAMLSALEIGPERASAWGSLGLIYAKQGKEREAVGCVLTAYQLAPNQKRVYDVYSRLAVSDDDPKVRALLTTVVSRLSKP